MVIPKGYGIIAIAAVEKEMFMDRWATALD
jgi:hypothetical protein